MNQPVPPSSTGAVLPPSSSSTRTGRRILVNTSALAGSNLWRIAIMFVLQLFVARKLGVEALGVYTITLAYLNVCQVISELGLPSLLVRDLAQAPVQRRGYFRLALTAQILAGVTIWGGLALLVALLPLPATTQQALWLAGASLPLYAVTSATQTLFQAGERMDLVMGVELTINTLILVVSVGLLWVGGGILHLVGILVATQLISALLGLSLLRHSQLLAVPQEALMVGWQSLRQRVGPFFTRSLAEVLLQRLDILLLSIVAGETITGIYSVAYNLVRVLLKLVQSFLQALYPTLSRLRSLTPAHYQRVAEFSLHSGLLLLLPCAAIGAGVAEPLLHLLFGADYRSTAPVFQLLVWSAPIIFIESYAGALLLIEHRPLQSLLITALHLLLVIVLLPGLTALADARGAAGAVILAGAVGAVTSILLLRRYHLPLMPSKPALLLAITVLTLLTALWLPWPWPLRGVAGAVLYSVFVWVSGLLPPDLGGRIVRELTVR